MTPKIVSTKEELKSAKEQGITEIIITGKLANDLKKSKKIAKALAKNGNLQYNFSILNSNNN